jgi:hypothetical protein
MTLVNPDNLHGNEGTPGNSRHSTTLNRMTSENSSKNSLDSQPITFNADVIRERRDNMEPGTQSIESNDNNGSITEIPNNNANRYSLCNDNKCEQLQHITVVSQSDNTENPESRNRTETNAETIAVVTV